MKSFYIKEIKHLWVVANYFLEGLVESHLIFIRISDISANIDGFLRVHWLVGGIWSGFNGFFCWLFRLYWGNRFIHRPTGKPRWPWNPRKPLRFIFSFRRSSYKQWAGDYEGSFLDYDGRFARSVRSWRSVCSWRGPTFWHSRCWNAKYNEQWRLRGSTPYGENVANSTNILISLFVKIIKATKIQLYANIT